MIDDLAELYRTQRAQFCRAAAAIAGDRAAGEDAVQDAFANAVRKRRSYRGRGSLEAWVWRIVADAARDARRKRDPLLGLRDRAEAPTPNGRGASLPLELLTDRQREVLFLHYYADLDYGTIAEALGISPGTVGATLSTARRVLRLALAPEVKS
jgi:DNA-directed RNA polymerase specialized sigma24 family protein